MNEKKLAMGFLKSLELKELFIQIYRDYNDSHSKSPTDKEFLQYLSHWAQTSDKAGKLIETAIKYYQIVETELLPFINANFDAAVQQHVDKAVKPNPN